MSTHRLCQLKGLVLLRSFVSVGFVWDRVCPNRFNPDWIRAIDFVLTCFACEQGGKIRGAAKEKLLNYHKFFGFS
jgi:hypothetical protein